MATLTHPILADLSAGISELKKNPMAVIAQAEGAPVAILNRNQPVFYAVPAEMYEAMLEQIDDIALAELIKQRQNDPEIEVNLDEL
jgi:antitoxin StbD